VEHPISEAGLRKFLAGTASREETRAIVAHLLKGCPSCSDTLLGLAREEVPEEVYDNVLDCLEKNLTAKLDMPVAVDRQPARRAPRGGARRPLRGARRDPPGGAEVRV